MRSRGFRLLASVLAAVLLLSSTSVAFAQEEAVSLDLGDLNLKVTNTEVVDEITNEQGGKLVAEEGQKLVVVTLQGNATEAGEIVAHPEGFIAQDTRTLFPSRAVALEGDKWVFGPTEQDREKSDAATLTLNEPGQVTFKVAFLVDEGVTSFDVLVPSVVEGTATVPDTGGTTPENGTTPNNGTTPDNSTTPENDTTPDNGTTP